MDLQIVKIILIGFRDATRFANFYTCTGKYEPLLIVAIYCSVALKERS